MIEDYMTSVFNPVYVFNQPLRIVTVYVNSNMNLV